MKIEFIPSFETHLDYHPKPASKEIPKWYKELELHMPKQKWRLKDVPDFSAKGCMPVFDALTAGYMLYTYTDVMVSEEEGVYGTLPYYAWKDEQNPIDFHPEDQALNHPKSSGNPYPKWRNPWVIKTPKGYSCLFVPPFHREETYFTILPGVVDTDSYISGVHLPFVLKSGFKGLIPAGTPMAQVIPFKRDTWKQEIKTEDFYRQERRNIDLKVLSKFSKAYKNNFWSKKEYR